MVGYMKCTQCNGRGYFNVGDLVTWDCPKCRRLRFNQAAPLEDYERIPKKRTPPQETGQ